LSRKLEAIMVCLGVLIRLCAAPRQCDEAVDEGSANDEGDGPGERSVFVAACPLASSPTSWDSPMLHLSYGGEVSSEGASHYEREK
jgi:hypothetical protein